MILSLNVVPILARLVLKWNDCIACYLFLKKLRLLLKIKQVVVERRVLILHNLASFCGLNLNRINLNKLKKILCIKAFVKMQPQASHSYFYATFFAACIQCALLGRSEFCKQKILQNYAILILTHWPNCHFFANVFILFSSMY